MEPEFEEEPEELGMADDDIEGDEEEIMEVIDEEEVIEEVMRRVIARVATKK